MQENSITVNSKSILPMVSNSNTQLIFQRHCNYDRVNGGLNKESVKVQEQVVTNFINSLKNNYSIEDIKNTYFLFASSNTKSSGDFKRCVETTDIAMKRIEEFLKENEINTSHIINLNELSNYKDSVHEDNNLIEPKMFIDNTGYLEYLKEKHNGMNLDFWVDFEEDLSKEKREELNSEGPDEIVDRTVYYINILQKYSNYFHKKNPNKKLIIWNGTHYDLISPFVKQRILNLEKASIVRVDYCGGISLILNNNDVIANMNGVNYPVYLQDKRQLHRHF